METVWWMTMLRTGSSWILGVFWGHHQVLLLDRLLSKFKDQVNFLTFILIILDVFQIADYDALAPSQAYGVPAADPVTSYEASVPAVAPAEGY